MAEHADEGHEADQAHEADRAHEADQAHETDRAHEADQAHEADRAHEADQAHEADRAHEDVWDSIDRLHATRRLVGEPVPIALGPGAGWIEGPNLYRRGAWY